MFLTVIGLVVRRTTIIESSALTLFVAYNVWLCGFSKDSLSGIVGFTSYASYAPLFENILPHLTTLANFITNTLPKHVLVSLIYRIGILLGAARILPSIGADSSWELAVDDADARPVRLPSAPLRPLTHHLNATDVEARAYTADLSASYPRHRIFPSSPYVLLSHRKRPHRPTNSIVQYSTSPRTRGGGG